MTRQAERAGDNWTRGHTNRARLWALSKGRPIDGAALDIVLTVKGDCVDEPFDRWTLDGLADLMWSYVPQWCASAGVPRPKHMAEALWAYLAYLDDAGGLASGSDDLESLQASLVAYGGLDRFGRARVGVRTRTRARSSEARNHRAAPTDDKHNELAPIIPLPLRHIHRPPLVAT